MAYTGTEGTYLKSEDITDILALQFLNATGADLGVYFKHADKMIVRLALLNDVSDSSIALEDDGSLTDAALREYGLCELYIKLLGDKSGAYNTFDTGNLSNSSAYDKYAKKIETYQKDAQSWIGKITADTIMGVATSGKNMLATIDYLRG